MSIQPIIITGKDVSILLESRSTITKALASQSAVFKAFSQSSSSSSSSNATSSSAPPIQAPLRITVQSNDITTLVMPARASADLGLGGIAIKTVSVPKEGAEGLPATTTVFDEKTGRLKAMVNARALTALRNACGSVLFLQQVVKTEQPKKLVLFGSGAQIRAHAILIRTLFPSVTTIIIVGRRSTERLDGLTTELKRILTNVAVSSAVSTGGEDDTELKALLSDADIIVAATPSTTPLFPSSFIPSNTKIILIGSYKPHMREIDDALVKRALQGGGKIAVDSGEACLAEAGELIGAGVGEGDLVELGRMLEDGGEVEGVMKGDVVIYKSVGIAIQDVAIANTMLEAALEQNIGTRIDDYD